MATGLPPTLNLEQIIHLHALTKDLAAFFKKQLSGYLGALGPLFAPKRIYGDHIEGGGKLTIPGQDKNLAELRELYERICTKPFGLRTDLAVPMEGPGTNMQLHEWQYVHTAGAKQIRVTSPLTWLVTYPSPYTPPVLSQILDNKQERDAEHVKQFVVRACLLHHLFSKRPEVPDLINGLRFRTEFKKTVSFGELPQLVISAPVSTIRPEDKLLTLATALSGGSTFEEVVDVETIRSMSDPMRPLMDDIVSKHPDAMAG